MTAPEHISTIIEMVIMRKEEWQLKYGLENTEMELLTLYLSVFKGKVFEVSDRLNFENPTIHPSTQR